jgi:hypothetical protein
MAIMMRWRWPPESWCGYESTMRCGSGSATSPSACSVRARRAA